MDRMQAVSRQITAFNEKQLDIADTKIRQIYQLSEKLHAEDFQELMYIYELRERLVVARSVIAHLKARKETRWHSFCKKILIIRIRITKTLTNTSIHVLKTVK